MVGAQKGGKGRLGRHEEFVDSQFMHEETRPRAVECGGATRGGRREGGLNLMADEWGE